MFASYAVVQGSSPDMVMSDIAAIVTGETNVANLSVACDKGLTQITTIQPPGWEVVDTWNYGGGPGRVFRALNKNGTSYKYARFALNATYLYVQTGENWDPVSHTGYNFTGDQMAYSMLAQYNGIIYIYATSKYLILMPTANGLSYGYAAVHELSGEAIEAGHPTHISVGSEITSPYNFSGIICRANVQTSSGDTANGRLFIGPNFFPTGSNYLAHSPMTYQNSSGKIFLTAVPLMVIPEFGNHAPLGILLDMLCTGTSQFADFDTITYKNVKYVLRRVNSAALMIPLE
jgi:hypothetical protein